MKIKHILLFLMAWVSSMNLAYAQQTVVASGSVMDRERRTLNRSIDFCKGSSFYGCHYGY